MMKECLTVPPRLKGPGPLEQTTSLPYPWPCAPADPQTEGGFPELKVLKQRIRNLVQPEKNLGHSDGHKKPNSE